MLARKLAALNLSFFLSLAPCFCFGQEAFEIETPARTHQIWIVRKAQAAQLICAPENKPLSWSADGRWLVLGEPRPNGLWKISLYDSSSAINGVVSLLGPCSTPSWSPDGRRFCFSPSGNGVRICDVSGSDPLVKPFLEAGAAPAWSPNGGRIAFSSKKPSEGIWISTESDVTPHKIDGSIEAERIVWSPDGRWILATGNRSKAKLQLVILSSTGKIKRELGDIDSTSISWSPNGDSILAKREGLWNVYSLSTSKWTKLGARSTEIPIWSGSKTVSVPQGEEIISESLVGKATESTPKPKSLPEGTIISYVPCTGVVLEGKIPSPFQAEQPPKPGQVRFVGTVEDIDLAEDTIVMSVCSIVSPDGMELNFAKPVRQLVRVTPNSKRGTGKGEVNLEATDFIQEGEVSLTVSGTKAGTSDSLPIVYGVIPELAAETKLSTNTTVRTSRSLEYDGVSMDTVTVPLVFPVLGKVQWEDSFLASRGGGSRRHHGQDLMAPKMRPLVAAFDGIVRFNTSKAGHNTVTLHGESGWTVVYMHVNNDTPGTDDGKGGNRFAFAPGLKSGDAVVRGQLLGFCGDSGNAEDTGPHCHFELHDDAGGGVLNAYPSLHDADHISEPVVIDPCPMIKPRSSETRWDIQVTKIDTELKVIVGELISESVGATLRANSFPKLVYIRMNQEADLSMRNSTESKASFDRITVGAFITVVGPTPTSNQAMDPRLIAIGTSIKN